MEEHGNKPRKCQKQGKARNMLDKAINYVIKARESKINARERFRDLRLWIVAKKLHPHP